LFLILFKNNHEQPDFHKTIYWTFFSKSWFFLSFQIMKSELPQNLTTNKANVYNLFQPEFRFLNKSNIFLIKYAKILYAKSIQIKSQFFVFKNLNFIMKKNYLSILSLKMREKWLITGKWLTDNFKCRIVLLEKVKILLGTKIFFVEYPSFA
jgi:hypothetical protein